jgi:hypothetical protein
VSPSFLRIIAYVPRLILLSVWISSAIAHIPLMLPRIALPGARLAEYDQANHAHTLSTAKELDIKTSARVSFRFRRKDWLGVLESKMPATSVC